MKLLSFIFLLASSSNSLFFFLGGGGEIQFWGSNTFLMKEGQKNPKKDLNDLSLVSDPQKKRNMGLKKWHFLSLWPTSPVADNHVFKPTQIVAVKDI